MHVSQNTLFAAWYVRHLDLMDRTNDADDEHDDFSDNDYNPITVSKYNKPENRLLVVFLQYCKILTLLFLSLIQPAMMNRSYLRPNVMTLLCPEFCRILNLIKLTRGNVL